jgi:hypothetical protein
MYAVRVEVGIFLKDVDDPAEACVGFLETDRIPTVGETLIVGLPGQDATGYRVTNVLTLLTRSSLEGDVPFALRHADYQLTVEPCEAVPAPGSAWG